MALAALRRSRRLLERLFLASAPSPLGSVSVSPWGASEGAPEDEASPEGASPESLAGAGPGVVDSSKRLPWAESPATLFFGARLLDPAARCGSAAFSGSTWPGASDPLSSARGLYVPSFFGLLSGPGAFSHCSSTIASERAGLQYGWREMPEATAPAVDGYASETKHYFARLA